MVVCIVMHTACSDDRIALPAPTIEQPEETAPISIPRLHVDGRYLKDAEGKIVNLHGFCQFYNPYFNEDAWSNYDVDACLRYNKGKIDEVLKAGWKMTFMRMQWAEYWVVPPGKEETYENFDEATFRKYLDIVHIPMMKYVISKGIYVLLCSPVSCPQEMAIDDDYHKYLKKVWNIVSQHPYIKDNPNIMFELANEPQLIRGINGDYGCADEGGYFENWKIFFQEVVDGIRENANNIIWVPGLGYSSLFGGCTSESTRIEGEDIGYAVHCYPGWMGSDGDNGDGGQGTGGGYEAFQQGWDRQVGPVADVAPIIITEMDWAPEKYNSSWGKGYTGTAGGSGFGANFKYITDNSGNVSWVLFTGVHLLSKFEDVPGTEGNYTFLNDPEACPWQCFHWFQEYANASNLNSELSELIVEDAENSELAMSTGTNKYLVVKAVYVDGGVEVISTKATYESADPTVIRVTNNKLTALQDGSTDIIIRYTGALGDTKEVTITVRSTTIVLDNIFPLTNEGLNPSIWGTGGTFDESTRTLITAQWGLGGWSYPQNVNLYGYKYLIAELGADNICGVELNIQDKNGKIAAYPFGTSRQVIINLSDMSSTKGLDLTQITLVGFWSWGGQPIVIDRVYVTNTAPYSELVGLQIEGGNNIVMSTGTEMNLAVKAVYADGRTETVTSAAVYQSSASTVISVDNAGKIKALADGSAEITVTYTDPLSEATKQAVVYVSSTTSKYPEYFPLTQSAFNPSIWDTGSFNEATQTFIPGPYGFGGWQFTEGIDLSKYKYLVAELESGNGNAAAFNIFDTNYYFGGNCATHPFGESLRVVVELADMTNDSGGRVDSSHIYYVGFWSWGNQPIVIKKVYITDELGND